jgi:hypothetical protein
MAARENLIRRIFPGDALDVMYGAIPFAGRSERRKRNGNYLSATFRGGSALRRIHAAIARFMGTRILNLQRPAGYVQSVQLTHGIFCGFMGIEFHKSEPP